MKRVNNLYSKIMTYENLFNAVYEASKGKRSRNDVKKVLKNVDYYINRILNGDYALNQCRTKIINERGKEREITMPNFFPDQIIHWAIMLQLKPIMMKGMYKYCCGSVPKRGISYGKNYIERIFATDKKIKYCLKLDIKKYFPSVDCKIMLNLLKRKIKDNKAIELLHNILGDGKGLPIGYYTSQWLSNFYLETLDHFIKEKLQIKYYIRYVDDMVLLDNNKRKLHKARIAIDDFLHKELDLQLKGNYQVFPLKSRAIDFLGFRFYKNNKTKIRKHIFLKLRRKLNKVKNKMKCNKHIAQSIISLIGWLKQTKSYNYYCYYIKPIIKIGKLRRIVATGA